jgi:hypothetical protein
LTFAVQKHVLDSELTFGNPTKNMLSWILGCCKTGNGELTFAVQKHVLDPELTFGNPKTDFEPTNSLQTVVLSRINVCMPGC